MKTEQEIRSWLYNKLSEILNLNIDELDSETRFKDYGLDSKLALSLINQFSTWLDKKLDQTLIWDYPTVNELVAHLLNPVKNDKRETHVNHNQDASEPIAIIGLSCRFPNAANKDAYWNLLKNGLSGIKEVPADRWDLETYFDEDVNKKGKMNTIWGGFIDQVDQFDAEFFGISPREAKQIDPQQRLMLELSWEALEDAGINPFQLKGSKTGVFYGAIWNDYLILNSNRGVNSIAQHTATGMHHSIIANRVSYFLGLQGPSMAIDTACSSSLVSVHLAVQSLRRGESTMALAGGVNLIIAPDSTISMTKFGAMAADGQSKAFDSSANGYVRGEGGGTVVLKPLSKALIDGDKIYALLLESAVNNDGFSNGLTAPNPKAQEEILNDVYSRAGVNLNDIQFIETHGTGTIIGDPIEAKAIGNVLCGKRAADKPLLLGSVKTNIGHLEGAAGIAGLIKVALSVKNRQIPPNLNFQNPNPNIPFDELRLKVPQQLISWPDPERPALAGVSSFGFGGTNCHVIVGELAANKYHVFPVSSATKKGLIDEVKLLSESIRENYSLQELSYRLSEKTGMKYREIFIAESLQKLEKQLYDFIQSKPVIKETDKHQQPIIFVCSGQGSQWTGMGKTLINTEPVFRAKMEQIDSEFKKLAGWSIIAYLFECGKNESPINLIQPVIFSIQVSLAALWESCGIKPDLILGHSMGEVAATQIAGIISLEDAIKIIYHRSSLLLNLAGKGLMALVELSGSQLAKAIEPYNGLVSVAAYNSPVSSVVAGDTENVKHFIDSLDESIFKKLIKVDVASHSYQTDALKDDLLLLLKDIKPLPGNIPVISTVSGAMLSYEHFTNAYWMSNVREPVKFSQAISALIEKQDYRFIELSAHPILTKSIEEVYNNEGKKYLIQGTIERNENDCKSMLLSLTKLYRSGYNLNWGKILKNESGNNCDGDKAGNWKILPLSAHSGTALKELIFNLLQKINTGSQNFEQLAYTAATKRSHHPYRAALQACNIESLANGLTGLLNENDFFDVRRKKYKADNLVFVFSGQGSQWVGMARDVYKNENVFQEVIKRCDVLLQELSGNKWSLIDKILFDTEFADSDTEYVQPVIFSIQVALAALWESWGIKPKAVIGHSMGEIAAACVSGALSLEDAVKIIYHRGKLMQLSRGLGGMILINSDAAEVQLCLEEGGFKEQITISACNSNANTLVSGNLRAVKALIEYLNWKDISCREFSSEYAFHSPLMEPYSTDFYKNIISVKPGKSTVEFYSTVTGDIKNTEELDAAYWVDNMVKPILFSSTVKNLLKNGKNVFIELGPHSSLYSPLQNINAEEEKDATVLCSLQKNKSSYNTLYTNLIALYNMGADLNWKQLFMKGGMLTDMPLFPFIRKRHWLDEDNFANHSKSVKQDIFEGPDNKNIFYETEWRIKNRNNNELQFASKGSWVIFADVLGNANQLISIFEKANTPYIKIIQGIEYKVIDTQTYQIDASNPDDYLKVFEDIKHISIAGIGYFGCLDQTYDAGSLTLEQLSNAQVSICRSVLFLYKAIQKAGLINTYLYFITEDTAQVKDQQFLQIQHAPVWSLARTISMESGIKCRNIDFVKDGLSVQKLNEELLYPDNEDYVVYRNSNRYVERLIKHKIKTDIYQAVKCNSAKVYIITGGLGGLGLKLAGWLLERGARHLLLLSKSGTLNDFNAYNALVKTGADIRVKKADVASGTDMENVFTELKQPLGGIIHAAGIVKSKLIEQQSWEEFNEVLLPKVQGVWNLHQQTKKMDIDFFVCISSISALMGSSKLSSYAAANSFLDSFINYRKSCGLPGTVVNLGPIANVGMLIKNDDVFDEKVLNKIGLKAIKVDKVIASLDYMLCHNINRLTVAVLDGNTLYDSLGLHTALINDFAPNEHNAQQSTYEEITGELEFVLIELQLITERVLAITMHSPDKNLFDSGLDSLMVIEFVRLVQSRFKIKFEPVLIYTHPTICSLADKVLSIMQRSQLVQV